MEATNIEELRQWAKEIFERKNSEKDDFIRFVLQYAEGRELEVDPPIDRENEILFRILGLEKDECDFKLYSYGLASTFLHTRGSEDATPRPARLCIKVPSLSGEVDDDSFYIYFGRTPSDGEYVKLCLTGCEFDRAIIRDQARAVMKIVREHAAQIRYVFFENEFTAADLKVECSGCEKSFEFDLETRSNKGCESWLSLKIPGASCVLETSAEWYIFLDHFNKNKILNLDEICETHHWCDGIDREPICDQCIQEMFYYGEIRVANRVSY